MFRYARPRRFGRGPDPMPASALASTLALVRESPLDVADALEDLGDEIATLAAHIHAATQRLLVLIAEFDQRRGWESGGHRSCAHWLSYRTGIDLGACREKVRTARVLGGLPETSAAMARGELSFSAVRALSRVATAENEGDLLELARGCTIAQLERTVRSWKRFTRMEEAELERERHESRSFSVFPDDDGMYVVKGRLPAEIGALLMRALDAASDALYREHPTGREASDAGRRKRAAQRRADSVGLLAECALAAGFGEGAGNDRGSDHSAPISGTRAERYQVVLHVDAETISSECEPGRSHLGDGTRVSAETSRRLSCDSGHVKMTHAPSGTDSPDGSILNVGRKTRTISPALRRALEFRDRGCRFPGCGLRFTDAHHIKHWADGGETSLGNCLLLCGHHHRLLHEGGWQVTWWGEGNPCFFGPRGRMHFDGRWKPPEVSERPVEVMIEANLTEGRTPGRPPPDGSTAGARWKREKDIPDDVYFRAMEAMG
jgi:uncharacterized protein DUF222/HNH endonuclease